MKRKGWSRSLLVEEVRRDIWRYVTAAARAEPESLLLEAAAVLGLSFGELHRLATIHFVLSPQVKSLLDAMSKLSRQLATTTVREEEISGEAVRGPILWGPTLSAQVAAGVRYTYVTAPARRAYETPENQVLVAALSAIVTVGRQTGWLQVAERPLADEVRDRVAKAEHWLQTRSLASVTPTPPSERTLMRVANGRASRRFRPAVDVLHAHREMVRRVNPDVIKHAVEHDALVATGEDRLFELLCVFAIEHDLAALGWKTTFPGLIGPGKTPSTAGGTARPVLRASDATRSLTLFYQQVPKPLSTSPIYRQVQEEHGMNAGAPLRPDLILVIQDGPSTRWILGEIKGGHRSPAGSARQALLDLLAYRRNYDASLASSPAPYGLGIAWGEDLQPTPNNEIVLCTQDKIREALCVLLQSPASDEPH
jgi:hypothetical protein